MKSELKKCPFCGSDAYLDQEPGFYYRVSCGNRYKCGATQHVTENKENAIASWIRRAGEDEET